MAREKKISQSPNVEDKKLFLKIGEYADIDITRLEYNDGQLEGISKNPRYLKESEHDKLKKSLTDSPEFLEYKPLMVYAMDNGNYVTICGNMRLRVANELRLDGHSEFDTIPCVVLKADTPIEKIKEYAIKDNVQAGNWDWDELANGEWETDDLQNWGVDCSFLNTDEDDTDIDELFEDAQNTESKVKDIKLSVHIPPELEDKVDEIKEIIKSAVSEYEGVEIK
ncbi:hypothetical protein DW657_17345 [Prevotella sp. AM23-5]|uniref:hypothetical protein n=1 Tax=Prevotellaceae TaxID=171552 RepID=UPI000E4D88AE|nr:MULTISPECIES: hypothetical protein [Prevotellaceae]RHN83270.1 hypothetical protein DW657_17345 [Prevotella sp. AM23-5]